MPDIFHVCRRQEWLTATQRGRYGGSSQDVADGFIHFSAAHQVARSVAKHRAGQADLVLVRVASESLGPSLKWEPSRSGKLFPHLYGELDPLAVTEVYELPLGADGVHRFPAELQIVDGE